MISCFKHFKLNRLLFIISCYKHFMTHFWNSRNFFFVVFSFDTYTICDPRYRGCKIHFHYNQPTDVWCHHEEIDIHWIFVMYNPKTLEITGKTFYFISCTWRKCFLKIALRFMLFRFGIAVWPTTVWDDQRSTWKYPVDLVQLNSIRHRGAARKTATIWHGRLTAIHRYRKFDCSTESWW